MHYESSGFQTAEIFNNILDTLREEVPEFRELDPVSTNGYQSAMLELIKMGEQSCPMVGIRDPHLEKVFEDLINRHYPLHKSWEMSIHQNRSTIPKSWS